MLLEEMRCFGRKEDAVGGNGMLLEERGCFWRKWDAFGAFTWLRV
jgi:hypothetical protein